MIGANKSVKSLADILLSIDRQSIRVRRGRERTEEFVLGARCRTRRGSPTKTNRNRRIDGARRRRQLYFEIALIS